jgi:hypothetical protein
MERKAYLGIAEEQDTWKRERERSQERREDDERIKARREVARQKAVEQKAAQAPPTSKLKHVTLRERKVI